MKKDQEKKAVILITIDALRADHLKSYGYQEDTAPNLEKFVEKGTTFLNAITNGPESPTAFSAIFTSILPFLDGGYSPLPKQKITVPQILKENGIFSFAIHSNPNLGRYFNYNRGFDIFLDEGQISARSHDKVGVSFKKTLSNKTKKILNEQFVQKLLYTIPGFNKIKNWLRKRSLIFTDLFLPFFPIAFNAPYIVNKVIKFLKHFNGPLFLWAHFMDVHRPYNPPTKNVLKFREKDFSLSERKFLTVDLYSNSYNKKITPRQIKNLKTLYDAEVNFVDDSLYSLFNMINAKFKKNCLIIITSDHGESFYEHETLGHQGSVFEELVRIPLFIIEKGRIKFLEKIDETVQSIDLSPTILDYFGIDIPENFQGKSLLPLLKGESLKREKPIITECFQKGGLMKRNNKDGFKLISIRKNTWKYVFDEEMDIEYLFNLTDDPYEKTNLIHLNPKKLEEFRLIKQQHLSQVALSNGKAQLLRAIDKLDFNGIK